MEADATQEELGNVSGFVWQPISPNSSAVQNIYYAQQVVLSPL